MMSAYYGLSSPVVRGMDADHGLISRAIRMGKGLSERKFTSPFNIEKEAPGRRTFETVEAFVEIPKGSRNKYELDHRRNVLFLDRVLYSSVHFPTDYGFIPGTKADDGDPLDVLIIVEEPTFPGCRVRIRPIGVLMMRDEKGIDEKILAVPVADPRFNGITNLKDIQKHWLLEIENFFSVYKELEGGKETSVEGWKEAEEARAVLEKYWDGDRGEDRRT
jgi:inorganic pyrophosphatase